MKLSVRSYPSGFWVVMATGKPGEFIKVKKFGLDAKAADAYADKMSEATCSHVRAPLDAMCLKCGAKMALFPDETYNCFGTVVKVSH